MQLDSHSSAMRNKPKVLLTRVLPQQAMTLLEQNFALEVNARDEVMSHARIIDSITDKEGLVCLLTDNVDSQIITKASSLKIIANYAVGFNNIDVAAATRKGIPVTNTPEVLTETTADLVMGLLLSVARRIVEADKYLRSGRFKGWAPELLLGSDVHGKILGIIGMGRIGQAVARRARCFDMTVIYNDTQRLPENVEGGYGLGFVGLEALLTGSDFVSVHAPLNRETHHLISTKELVAMKRSAYLINAARGPIVDEQALVRALKAGEIAGCALDVYENEPAIASQLLQMPNVVLVPHIGSASVEARAKMALMVVDNLVAVLKKKVRPPNVVNPEIYKQ
jgi:glyoxylate reductase